MSDDLILNPNDDDLELLDSQEDTPFAPLDYSVKGEVLRVIYSNHDTGYSVVRLLDDKYREHTLVGIMPNIMEGQDIEASGRWILHKEHGRQLNVTSYHTILPTSKEGIARYLASGILPGIGETFAARIVDHFGEDTIKILDNASERLKEVPGIGKKRIKEIREAWKDASAERETRIYLQGIGLSMNTCNKVIDKYGKGAAAEIVRRNPYRLANEIDGVGFLSADAIANKLGIEKNNPLRICSGIVYALDEFTSSGHTCIPEVFLLNAAEKLLDVEKEELANGLKTAVAENKIVLENVVEAGEDVPLYFPRRLRQAEINLARSIKILINSCTQPQMLPPYALNEKFSRLNKEQKQAVSYAFDYGFSIITGGPGVGKTTVVNQIAFSAKKLRMKIYLAAPTGRAAKRLSEATGEDAQTIHRLLKWDVKTKAFVHNQDTPLNCDIIVVDEVSMLDTYLADSLFAALEPGTKIVLVGDKDQLPSVGPGAVLSDLISCGKIPVTCLTQVYRQAGGSRIITNAHAVNNGQIPDLQPVPSNEKSDFYWMELDDPLRAAASITKTVAERVQKVFGFNPVNDVQVLCPMRKGECGTSALNEMLQKALNPDENKPSFKVGNRIFRAGDKVMQTTNNYDKGIFNGEMGIISLVDTDARKFQVTFDAGIIEYEFKEIDQLQLAYAITVHKSQGSEFPVVVMPLLTQHYVMLQKNLIYTGMTRAKKLLIMMGSSRALAIAIGNNSPNKRKTRLAQRIVQLLEK